VTTRRLIFAALALAPLAAFAGAPVRIVNNQPFAFHQPLEVRTADRKSSPPVAMIFTDQPVAPGGTADAQPVALVASGDPATTVTLKPAADGLTLHARNENLGTMRWGILVQPAPRESNTDVIYVPDIAATFAPLPLEFRHVDGAPAGSFAAEATTQGVKLRISTQTYPGGFVDFRTELINESRTQKERVYCAVVKEWTQPRFKTRTVGYDNRRSDLTETTTTPFRRGTGHHHALQRGIDWINTSFENGVSCVRLNDFTESFPYFVETGANPRWSTANQPMLGEEAQSIPGKLYTATEITRGMIRRFRDRFVSYVLPEPGRPVVVKHRYLITSDPITDKAADDTFVGYTCYKEQTETTQGTQIAVGVPHVTFGTSYFPYSTLGENFDFFKLPGMDREGYWPLAADTVNQWQLFRGEIARDLRIAKSMGFDNIRMHHFELLAQINEPKRFEYLDFFFGELRHLGLKALVDIHMKPEEVAEVVRRYGDAMAGVEIENEVLIWGIKEGREKYWNAVYDAVKAVDPQMPVNLTSHANAGVFTKLEELGGKSDKVVFHSYVDGLDAIISGRGIALAVGNYAAERGMTAGITEWNWRFLTRLPFEERAKVYPQIIGNALVTRSIAEFYQFQFNDTIAVNPRGLRGIRHYEPLFLSRRPKPEAFELMKLVKQYSAKDHAVNKLDISYTSTTLSPKGDTVALFNISNLTKKPMTVTCSLECGDDLQAVFLPGVANPATGKAELSLSEGASGFTDILPVQLMPKSSAPGFYHFFLRVETEDGILRYGWGEARLAGAPPLDLDTPTTVTYPRGIAEELKFDLGKPVTVVYGVDPPDGLDVESAILIANTLESASGHPVALYQENLLPKELAGANLILIGTPEANTMVAQARAATAGQTGQAMVYRVDREDGAQSLVVTGTTPVDVEYAAVDFVLRYWRNAKDSATRKLGGKLLQTHLRQGADPTKLP
jgi:hypothetical protein